MRRRPAVVVVVLGPALLVIAALAAMAPSEPRLAGTNDLRAGLGFVVPPGEELCQGPAFVPGDAARARLVVHEGPATGSPLRIAIRDDGRTLAAGEGGAVIGFAPETVSRVVDEVCFANRGDALIQLGGQALPPEQSAEADGEPVGGRVRIEWLRAGEESWLELAPTVVHRFGLAKADWLGSWTIWLVLALVLGSWAGAVRLVAGSRPR